MKFSTREDIAAPADQVFAAVSDFENFERLILRRGAKIERVDTQTEKSVGMCWDVGFRYRGRDRRVRATVMKYAPPETMTIMNESGGIDGQLDVSVIRLNQKRTRLMVTLDLKPKSLSARLLLQSMKLAKSTLAGKFSARVAEFGREIEGDYKAAA